MLITTERLVLRRFRDADAATLAAYRSDPEVARYQFWTAPVTEAEARATIAAMAGTDPQRPGWFQYAVERTADRRHVGDLAVRLDDNLLQADLGCTMAPAYQGQGYAGEAVHAVLDHLFRVRGLHKVSARADARNRASVRVLERTGFTREGLLRAHTLRHGEWADDVLYGLLAGEWTGQPS